MPGTPRIAPLCVILCPPWVRSGSANLFAAQARAYLDMGFEVAVIAVPHDRALVSSDHTYWKTVADEFRFAPRQRLFLNRSTDRRLRFVSASYRRWLRAGRPSAMAVEADIAAHSRPDAECAMLLSGRPIALIHVNHCINMALASRLADISARRHASRPALVLETQDIQVERYRLGGIVNPFTRRADRDEDLARDEAELCRGADALVHLTPRDHAHFATLVPDRMHTLVRPTLRSEPTGGIEVGGGRGSPEIDFAYVGNGHRSNARSIEWFLSEVMPRLEGSGLRVRIAGAVEHSVWHLNTALHAAYRSVWLGEVDSVDEVYASTRFVIAPTVAASGISIKIVGALAMGKAIVTSPAAMVGFEGIEGIEDAVTVATDAAAFADAMQALASGVAAVNRAGRSVYEHHFSNARYLARLSDVARRVGALPAR